MPTYEELMGGATAAPTAKPKPTAAKTSFSYEELMGQAGPATKPAAPLEEPAFEREAKSQKSASFFDNAGTHLAAGAADVVDFLVTGIFGMPVAAASDAAIRATPGAVKAVPAVGVINALQYAGQRIGGKLTGDEAGLKAFGDAPGDTPRRVRAAGDELLEASLGGTRAQIGARAQASTETTMKALGQPARDLLRITGLLPEGYESAADKGFAYAMKKVEEAGQVVEARTGGAVKKEDVQSVVTYAFGTMGVKGVQATAKGVATMADQAKAKRVFKELETIQVEKEAGVEAARQQQLEAGALASETPASPYAPHKTQADANLAAADSRVNAEKQAYDLMRAGADTKTVERAIKRNPALGAAMAAVRERRSRANAFLEQADLPPIKEDGTFREGALGAILRRPSEMSPTEIAARTAAAGGRMDPALSAGEFGRSVRDPKRRSVAGQPMLPPEPVIKRGPLGEPIEAAPPRPGQKGAVDQQLLTAMAVGATGLGLAMIFKPDADELALAIGGGALVAGRGKLGDLTLEAIRNTPDATPLRALLERDTTTLSTLELLNRQSPNRFEFGIDSIKQLLKRPEVTKAERDVFDKILAAVPEGATTITAKELMEGKKIATGDFELRKKADQQYAAYGLEQIDRVAIDDYGAATFPGTERLTDEAMSVAMRDAPEASTHIWQSPIELGSNNHFGDPNYFGHTRVFEENGVRHVVELQSDLAQKAGKVLTAEERARLEGHMQQATVHGATLQRAKQELSGHQNAKDFAAAFRREYESWPENLQNLYRRKLDSRSGADELGRQNFLRGALKELESEGTSGSDRHYTQQEMYRAVGLLDDSILVAKAEARAKLAQVGALESISPMLRDWHKRLIREELADGARAGETMVRFADADTVAKVEGWPKQNDAITRDARQSVEAAERNLTEMEARLQTRGGATPAEQAEARELIPVIREDIRRAREAYAAARDAQVPAFRPEHQGIYDRYSRDVTKFLKQLGGTHIVDSAGHGWWEVPVEGSKASPAGKRAQQFGGASEDLLKSLALVGGGAALAAALSDPENKAGNALWAASLAGLALWARSRTTGLADMAQGAIHTAETFLGNISSEVRDMSPAALRRLTRHETAVHKHTFDVMQRIGPFVEKLSRVPADKLEALNAAIITGKSAATLRELGRSGQKGIIEDWRKVRATLEDLGRGLVETGRLKELLADYYPRIVVDYPGLMKELGQEARVYMDELIARANDKSLRATGEGLSPLDISLLVNKHLERAYNATGNSRAGFLKKRSIEDISPQLAKYYAPASESLPLYVQAAVKEIERARFFGKDLVRNAETGTVDLDASIGNIVLAERRAGRLSDVQLGRLEELLRSRFGPGERASSRGVQAFRNMGNAMLLGNIFSAAQNVADIGIISAAHGIVPAALAVIQTLRKSPERITAADMGMAKHIAEEFVHGTRSPVKFKLPGKSEPIQISTAKFVDWTFKMSGWRLLDIGAKEIAANAAIIKHQRLARNVAGQADIRRRYADYFGRDIDQLVADLRSSQKTPLVQELGIRELADTQPISKIELPKGYNDHPNLRVAYMLKSYSLKQLNLIRDRGVKEIMRGNRRAGLEFLIRYGLLAGTAGMTAQNLIGMMLGRDADWSKEAMAENMFRTFGFSTFVMDKVREGKAAEAIGTLVVPPVGPFADILMGKPESIRYIPIVGRAAYFHLGGGAEKANERLEKTKEKREDN